LDNAGLVKDHKGSQKMRSASATCQSRDDVVMRLEVGSILGPRRLVQWDLSTVTGWICRSRAYRPAPCGPSDTSAVLEGQLDDVHT
jgi:hypothetical protein